MSDFVIHPIAHIQSDFPDKFGIPRQAGIVPELESRVIFEPEYRNPDALRGMEDFSHLWLIWQFSKALRDDWSPTVRPPRLGGNQRVGVFASRSPFRPNGLGLSCVRLLGVEQDRDLGPILRVGGADLMDGTPIFDIKPYLPYADSYPDAASGFAPDAGQRLQVRFLPGVQEAVPAEKRHALTGVLANDPRPRYQADPDRVYGFDFADLAVKFRVDGDTVMVIHVEKK